MAVGHDLPRASRNTNSGQDGRWYPTTAMVPPRSRLGPVRWPRPLGRPGSTVEGTPRWVEFRRLVIGPASAMGKGRCGGWPGRAVPVPVDRMGGSRGVRPVSYAKTRALAVTELRRATMRAAACGWGRTRPPRCGWSPPAGSPGPGSPDQAGPLHDQGLLRGAAPPRPARRSRCWTGRVVWPIDGCVGLGHTDPRAGIGRAHALHVMDTKLSQPSSRSLDQPRRLVSARCRRPGHRVGDRGDRDPGLLLVIRVMPHDLRRRKR